MEPSFPPILIAKEATNMKGKGNAAHGRQSIQEARLELDTMTMTIVNAASITTIENAMKDTIDTIGTEIEIIIVQNTTKDRKKNNEKCGKGALLTLLNNSQSEIVIKRKG